MRRIAWIFLLVAFYFSSFAASRQEELPDREMLKLMELLKDWDMIKDLDMMRQLETLDRMQEAGTESGAQQRQRGKTKDQQK